MAAGPDTWALRTKVGTPRHRRSAAAHSTGTFARRLASAIPGSKRRPFRASCPALQKYLLSGRRRCGDATNRSGSCARRTAKKAGKKMAGPPVPKTVDCPAQGRQRQGAVERKTTGPNRRGGCRAGRVEGGDHRPGVAGKGVGRKQGVLAVLSCSQALTTSASCPVYAGEKSEIAVNQDKM